MIDAIIVAAGKGVRMQARLRKQFIDLNSRPILVHTLRAFDACRAVNRLIVVVPENEITFCQRNILEPASLGTRTLLVAGGKRRQDSVHNGLSAITEDDGIVLIHDGVRPLVTQKLIEECIDGAARWGACIPAILPVDTPKQIHDDGVIAKTLGRDSIRLAQTPQAFQLDLIRQAHEEAVRKNWDVTDDASLVERLGGRVHTIEGLTENIKITTPQDLQLAQYYLTCAMEKVEQG